MERNASKPTSQGHFAVGKPSNMIPGFEWLAHSDHEDVPSSAFSQLEAEEYGTSSGSASNHHDDVLSWDEPFNFLYGSTEAAASLPDLNPPSSSYFPNPVLNNLGDAQAGPSEFILSDDPHPNLFLDLEHTRASDDGWLTSEGNTLIANTNSWMSGLPLPGEDPTAVLVSPPLAQVAPPIPAYLPAPHSTTEFFDQMHVGVFEPPLEAESFDSNPIFPDTNDVGAQPYEWDYLLQDDHSAASDSNFAPTLPLNTLFEPSTTYGDIYAAEPAVPVSMGKVKGKKRSRGDGDDDQQPSYSQSGAPSTSATEPAAKKAKATPPSKVSFIDGAYYLCEKVRSPAQYFSVLTRGEKDGDVRVKDIDYCIDCGVPGEKNARRHILTHKKHFGGKWMNDLLLTGKIQGDPNKLIMATCAVIYGTVPTGKPKTPKWSEWTTEETQAKDDFLENCPHFLPANTDWDAATTVTFTFPDALQSRLLEWATHHAGNRQCPHCKKPLSRPDAERRHVCPSASGKRA